MTRRTTGAMLSVFQMHRQRAVVMRSDLIEKLEEDAQTLEEAARTPIFTERVRELLASFAHMQRLRAASLARESDARAL